MLKVTREKVKAMTSGDIFCVACDNAAELDNAYQTAMKAKRQFDLDVNVSKSTGTMTVVIRKP